MDVNETFTQSGAGITDAELKLWELMRDQQLNGFKFIRQVLVEPFIVDFVCVELKFIVELDGGSNTERQYYDLRRTEYLRNRGYLVVRFFNAEVLTGSNRVVETLKTAIEQRVKETGLYLPALP